MHEDDGDGADAVVVGGLQQRAGAFEVERRLDGAVGADALFDLDDALIEHFRQHDLAREQVRAGLIADAQLVAESAGGRQQGAVALALQERVGRHRGAHLDGVDLARRDRRVLGHAQQVADALDGGIPIGLRILGQQLVRLQFAVRLARHDIREGAAAVDPKLPTSFISICFYYIFFTHNEIHL